MPDMQKAGLAPAGPRSNPHALGTSIVRAGQDNTLEARFQVFHMEHPEVYESLARLSREWVRRTGRRRLGIDMVYARARWELSIQTGETPSLNNDYRAPYARLLMEQEPDLRDLFETRRSQVDPAPNLSAGCAQGPENQDADAAQGPGIPDPDESAPRVDKSAPSLGAQDHQARGTAPLGRTADHTNGTGPLSGPVRLADSSDYEQAVLF